MSQTLKKIFSSFVSLTTIAWSVGVGTFALPGAASAATLYTGDLIKASGPAVYFYAADQKRYVFPNEKTYYSWYNDFSAVKTISDGELAAIYIGGNVTIRPGTKLVKITTDPKVYAVTRCGTLHWVESEALATALWGASWAQRVVDVPDGFFVNYTVGSSIPTAIHPDGSLIMYAGNASKYVVWGGQKRLFASDAAFYANGFNPANIITTTISYPDGAAVTGRESDLADTVCTAGAPISGSLTVALASDTPAGATVPKNAASVQMAKFNLTAGASAVTVTGLKLHRVGVGATSDFANVYLYDSNGTRLTTGRSINSTTNLAEFNSLNINVAAGQTVSIVVVADFATPTSTGGQHSFEVMDAASVVISGTGTVSGSFPVRGNVFTVGTTLAARIDVQKGTQPSNPNIGAMDAEISNFKLVANTNDVSIRRVTLLQAGGVSNSDLTNLNLYQGTTVVATAAALSGDKIVLNFNPPFLLTNGTTKTFSLHSKVAGRAGRTIKTYVEYTTDVYAIDQVYSAGAAVCIASTATGGCTSTGQGSFDGTGGSGTSPQTNGNFIEVLTQGGTLTLTFNGPPATNISKGQQDVQLFKFSMASPDNTLEIRNMDFTLAGTTAQDLIKGSASTEYFRDLKIKNLDTGATVMGPTSLSSSLAASSTTSGLITFTDSFNINVGQILNLAFTADTANSEDVTNEFFTPGTHNYKVTMGDGSGKLFGSSDVRIVDTGEFLATDKIVPNSTIAGNVMTVKASNLTVALASSPTSATIVKKQQNVPSVAFVLSAGQQSDILVTSIKLTGVASTTGAGFLVTSFKDAVTQCALFNGTTQVGLAQNPDSTAGTMNITNMNLNIPKGTSVILTAECTADSVIDQTNGDKFAVGIAADGDVTAQDQDSNNVTASVATAVKNQATGPTSALISVIMTVLNSGTLTIATNNLRQPTILVAGGDVWQNFAEFRATAQFENMAIDRMTVTSTGDAANFSQVAIAQNGAVKGWDVLPAGQMKSKDVDLTASNVVVPKDSSTIFQIWGKLNNTQSSSSVNGATTGAARSGNTMSLGLAANVVTGEWNSNYADKFNVRANGAASGDRVYAATTAGSTGTVGNSFVLRKSKPTVTRQALSSTTLSGGAQTDLYKFQVSADAAGSIAVKKFTFSFAKTTSTGSTMTISNFKLRRGSSDVTPADYQILDQSGNDLTSGTWDVASSSGKIFVTFVADKEDVISGSGNVYTLYASINGSPVAGDSVSISLFRTSDSAVYTGYLTSTTMASGGYQGPNINTSSTPTDAADVQGTFVWSDQSEVPHSATTGTAPGSSRDWTNDLYLEDLTQQQTLSR